MKGGLMMTYNKPLPNTKGIAEQFWNGLKNRQFLVQKCSDCKSQIFYPRVICPYCGTPDPEFKEHNGLGEIYSFTIIYKTRHPEFKKDVPYALALIDLDGGGRMMTNIIECDIEDVKIGAPVEIQFTDVTDSITLPHFKLVKSL